MNTLGNTPPDGDFAKYVERLSAQSATARRTSQADGEHSLEGGPTHTPNGTGGTGSYGGYGEAGGSAGSTVAPKTGASAAALRFKLVKVLAVIWLLILFSLVGTGAPVATIVTVLALGIWSARGLRRWAMPPGVASWSEWLRNIATNAQKK